MPDTISTRRGDRAAALAERLAQAIHEHRLVPGTKLGEDDIGDIYGVSRTVVRAALQRLSHGQIVDIRPNRGAYVARPSVREAREVFEARALLEPRTARSAAERASLADIARLRQHIQDEHAAMAARETGTALRLSGVFHIEISRIADQDIIAGFVEGLIARSSLVIALYHRRASAVCESHAHHALIDALEAGDGPRAEDLMKGHLVDLLSALDLTETPTRALTLREMLDGTH